MSSVADIFNMDILASLTERLAQAEREKAALSVDINRRDHEYSKLERERDEWKAKYEGHGVWAAMSPDTMARVLKERTAERDDWRATASELTERAGKLRAERDEWKAKAAPLTPYGQQLLDQRTAERDAALAKADELTRKHQHSEAGRMAAVGRADAAESELADRIKSAQHYGHEAALAHGQLADLRARIEALADNWGDAGWAHARALRALLQPVNPETALDFFNNMVRQNTPTGYEVSESDWAKLRKLLEEQK